MEAVLEGCSGETCLCTLKHELRNGAGIFGTGMSDVEKLRPGALTLPARKLGSIVRSAIATVPRLEVGRRNLDLTSHERFSGSKFKRKEHLQTDGLSASPL